MKTSQTSRGAFCVACAGALLLFTSCATSAVPANTASTTASPKSNDFQSPPMASNPDHPQAVADPNDDGNDNARALQELWRARSGDRSLNTNDSSFIIGPGDILRISLPQLDQMKDRRVRVSEKDTIDLPLIGVINVAGMNQQDLHEELSRLVEKYVYKPQVAVYLEHTENRVVGVLGAVKTPGRYMLASTSDTILTMISRAGGTTEDAATRIILIPAPDSTGSAARSLSLADNEERGLDAAVDTSSPASLPPGHQSAVTYSVPQQLMNEGVVIDLFHSANQRYLELPVKMGDVIIVPVAGEVTVQGWVEKAGSFKITRGMTVLSAVAAAGGALFSSDVTLLREEGNDSKQAIHLNLTSMKNGTQRDVALQGGDVVVVERSVAGAPLYTGYFLINKMGWGIFPAF
jgi:polysaccharide biosynthesis/export protein